MPTLQSFPDVPCTIVHLQVCWFLAKHALVGRLEYQNLPGAKEEDLHAAHEREHKKKLRRQS